MSSLFKDIPEFVETNIGECLTARTETLSTFRELGPPDLCHVVKSYGSKATQKDTGSYHYCSGVEASSSASVAAYLNSLQFHLDESPAWFGKGNGWRVRSGTYCCFNAFSRVDMRVEVRIPGGVDAYAVDVYGERHEATPDMWLETFVSAILRAIRHADDGQYQLVGYRRIDPITTVEGEMRFLKAAEDLFFYGWELGSDPEVECATIFNNHLTAAILKYFGDSFRLERAANFFERMYEREPQVASLLAQAYLGMNEEIKAVQIMNAALKQRPSAYNILLTQADFLLKKNKPEWARDLGERAVASAPTEFMAWAKLTEAYIELGEFDKALLTLNSCPMYDYHRRDLHHMPNPAKTNLPIKKFLTESGLLDEEAPRGEVDVALLRLPAPGLRGTFAKTYELLTLILSKIGWDELLKYRTAVFFMGDEFMEHEAEAQAPGGENGHADEDASTRGIPGSARASEDLEAKEDAARAASSQTTPKLRVSTVDDDDTRGSPEDAAKAAARAEKHKNDEDEKAVKDAVRHEVAAEMSKPGQLQSEKESDNDMFEGKQLCSRWFDNLFVVLYEDLRVYRIWREEIAHFQRHRMVYKKTGAEWEILGELALRLHHKAEAKEAFMRCLEHKFSPNAMAHLLKMYADEGDLKHSLDCAIKLTVYNHAWYFEAAYPSPIAHAIYKLGLVHGLSKIENTLLSLNLPDGVFGLMLSYLKYARTFTVDGAEY